MPIKPFSCVIFELKDSFLPFIIFKGKNVALPSLLLFKYPIRFFATSSFLVITFEIAEPSAISIAVSYCFSTLKISPNTFVSSALEILLL